MKPWLIGGMIAEAVLLIGFISLSLTKGDQSILPLIIFFFGENPKSPMMGIGFAFLYFAIGAGIGWLIGLVRSR